jgi:hypothetical protein
MEGESEAIFINLSLLLQKNIHDYPKLPKANPIEQCFSEAFSSIISFMRCWIVLRHLFDF